jgi:hypothetical protein
LTMARCNFSPATSSSLIRTCRGVIYDQLCPDKNTNLRMGSSPRKLRAGPTCKSSPHSGPRERWTVRVTLWAGRPSWESRCSLAATKVLGATSPPPLSLRPEGLVQGREGTGDRDTTTTCGRR